MTNIKHEQDETEEEEDTLVKEQKTTVDLSAKISVFSVRLRVHNVSLRLTFSQQVASVDTTADVHKLFLLEEQVIFFYFYNLYKCCAKVCNALLFLCV